MVRLILSSLIVIIFSIPIFGKKPVYKSSFHAGPVVINAVLDEWPATLIVDKSGFEYSVMNDSTHLYLCLLFREQEIRQKVQRMGLTVWIDPRGKKKSRYGINFPMKQENRPNKQVQSQGRPDSKTHTGQLNLNNSFDERMMLTGFSGKKEEEIIHPQFQEGVKVALLNNGYAGLYYELSIDLSLITDNSEQYFSEIEKYLSIGFETGFRDMNTKSPGGTGMSGRGRSGGGGARSGGGGIPGGQRPSGGGQRGQGGDISYMTQQTRLWIKNVQLTLE